MKSGIYIIENIINEKIYVGQSVNISKRWYSHKKRLRSNRHYNSHLQNAWNKYGEEKFEFKIVEECDIKILIEREQCWLNKTKSFNKEFGYNVRKIAESNCGRKLSEEHKKKISGRMKGKNHPQYGVPISEETKKKISDFYKKNIHPLKGKEVPLERRKKISEALKGNIIPNDVREKIRQNVPQRKLNWAKVKEIRRLYNEEKLSQQKISILYNVARTTIQKIIENRSWKENISGHDTFEGEK